VRLSAEEFRAWKNKGLTLLGMSGVGKTRVANLLCKRHWFHYSVDYRIGTRYLSEPILDNIKSQAMQIPFLRDLLRSDSIHITNNITVDNLKPVSSFLGKLGDPEKGGLGLREFKRRQELHREAEIGALIDVPEFIRKAHDIYGYENFINDTGGSVCELDDPDVLQSLAAHTLIIYIKATDDDQHKLIERAEEDPKPLYYREAFLDEQLAIYLQERGLPYIAMVDPDDFVRWVFPRLYSARMPRYQKIADEFGYTVSTDELAQVNDEADLMRLLENLLDDQPSVVAAEGS